MKKIASIILAILLLVSCAACNARKTSSPKTTGVPGESLNTLNAVFADGFEAIGTQVSENLYVQTVLGSNAEQYVLIVKVPDEQYGVFREIDFLDENAQQQYLDIIGDNEFTDVLVASRVMPSQEQLDFYKDMTIAEFEMQGAEMTGYAGANGKYTFSFSDYFADYNIVLEKGVKLEDLDDFDAFDAAIQDKKIGSIECTGISSLYLNEYIEQFFDELEKSAPIEMGEAKSSLDELNSAIGSKIKAISGATEEKFSIIDEKIAQYIYQLDGVYYCIRSSADINIDLVDNYFSESSLVGEDGYYTTSYSQTDICNSVRFIFNDFQYVYIIYDNGEFDWDKVEKLENEFRNSICEYKDDSPFKEIIGQFTSNDGYTMSVAPVSDNSAQVSTCIFGETETRVWYMIIKYSDGKFTYDKSLFEIYKDGESTSSEAGGGVITIKDSSLIWDKHSFTKAKI